MLHEELSYVTRPVEEPIPYTTIPDMLKERAKKQPSDEAFIIYSPDGQRMSITFGDLLEKSQLFASSLTSLGIGKNDRVVVYMICNTEEWLTVEFGIILIGAIPVNCYAVLDDGSDLDYVIKKTLPSAIIVSMVPTSHALAMNRLLQKANYPFLKHVITLDSVDDTGGHIPFPMLMKRGETQGTVPPVFIDPDDILIIYRSSGTTGRPKLISHSHRSIIRTCWQTAGEIGSFKCKVFTNMGFPWLGGSVFPEIINGTCKVTMSGRALLSISAMICDILKVVKNEKCNVLALTMDAINRIIQENITLPECVKAVCLGGCPIQKIQERFLKTADALICGYATLEIGRIAGFIVREGERLESNIAGFPLPGVEVKIINARNEIVPRETIGNIFVRSQHRFLEFVGEGELTKKTITAANWVDTSDLGYITKTGKLFVIGRSDDAIRGGTGGTKQPAEIETIVRDMEIPEIQELAVVPVPDKIHHHVICVCVVLKPGRFATEPDLLKRIQGRIIHVCFNPKHIVFMTSFPINRNGKVDRTRLIRMATERLE